MSDMLINPYRFDTIIMPYRHEGPAWATYDAESGFNYTRAQSSTFLGGGVARQGTDATADNGDSVSWFVNLAAGTYTLTVIDQRNINRAIHEYFLDSTSLGTSDRYNATNDSNAVVEITGIVVAADGNYTFKMAANSKHASSTEYYVQASWWCWTRTGA